MMDADFVQRIVADLRGFAAPLLEIGLAPRGAGARTAGGGSLGSLHASVERMTELLPRLLEEAARDNRLSRRFAHRSAPIPRRARASRAPWDYEFHEGNLLPSQWISIEPLPMPDAAAVAYLRFLLDLLGEQLERSAARLGKHLEDARRARSDSSTFARDERDQIDRMTARVRTSRTALARARQHLRSLGGAPAGSRGRAPRPYPNTRAWRELRALARSIRNPATTLPQWLGALLDATTAAPELPYLYQRWCGVQVLEALNRAGFRARHDPIGAIFLGELAIELADAEGATLTLWCEPRLIAGREHPSGLTPVRVKEQQPDYLLVAAGERGTDAYVLDATLSTDPDRLDVKGEYRSSLVFGRLRPIAGVPAIVHPERSWAAAPIGSELCRLGDVDGRRGTVPLHPAHGPRALEAWLGDVVRRARAWRGGA